MASLIEIKKISDERGNLVVIEDQIPFAVARVFYIFGVPHNKTRGGHRHKVTRMALVAVSGSCTISIDDGTNLHQHDLNSPQKVLLVEPQDYHHMYNFSSDCVLMVLASHKYNKNDYIFEGYSHDRIRKPA